MKQYIVIMVLVLSFLLSLSLVFSEEITGLEVMTNVDQREDGDDQVSEATFTLINRRGKKRIRKTVRYWKDYDGEEGFDEKSIIFFKSPPDVKKTGFLNWSYKDINKDDDQWLYLPALRKVRRISSSGKEDSFMGTDFTFDDMGDRQVEEDRHRMLKRERYEGDDTYVIESIPVDKDYIYSKKITWVDQKRWVDLKAEYYDRKGRLLKTLKTTWQEVGGIWVPKRLHMKNHQSEHQTFIDISEVQLNRGLSEKLFTKNRIRRGIE